MERDQAFARLATVAGAELLAGVICWLPLLLAPDGVWRAECRFIAVLTTIAALVVISVAFVLPWVSEWVFERLKYVAEVVSLTIFGIDLVALVVAVLRTGGTSDSFYAPLLSVLITLVLLFELQKEMIGGSKSRLIWVYSGMVFATWLAAAYVSYVRDLNGDKVLIPKDVRAMWTCTLTLLGIITAVVAYVLPEDQMV
ncbi:MAG TPA: hypothetical protein VJ276_26565 [Thermoanaerobaculia bacterium]|nr:hypothetical protein [Thermoanaerobaculia bacterium]